MITPIPQSKSPFLQPQIGHKTNVAARICIFRNMRQDSLQETFLHFSLKTERMREIVRNVRFKNRKEIHLKKVILDHFMMNVVRAGATSR